MEHACIMHVIDSPSEDPKEQAKTRIRVKTEKNLPGRIEFRDVLMCPTHVHDGPMSHLHKKEVHT